jgi:hypothetical protein
MKKAIITYIFGGYDRLKDPALVTAGWDYLCFSDVGLCSAVWQPRTLPAHSPSASCAKRIASWCKIMHHVCVPEDYDVCVTIDGSMQINTELDAFLAEVWSDDADLAIARHPARDCLFDEAKVVVDLGFDHPAVVESQMKRYAKAGFPHGYGLFGTRLMVKNSRSPRLRAMCQVWAEEMLGGSRRDQLSLTYALWRQAQAPEGTVRLRPFDFDEVYHRRKLFEITPHLGSRSVA